MPVAPQPFAEFVLDWGAFLILNGLLVLNAAMWLHRWLSPSLALDWVLGIGILATGQVLLSSFVLGGLGLLRLGTALGFLLCLTLVTTWFVRPRGLWAAAGSLAAEGRAFFRSLLPAEYLALWACAFSQTLYLVLGLIAPPLHWDTIAYHLPFAVNWLKTGSLEAMYLPFAGPIGYYPGNAEALALWSMLPFSSDLLTNLVNMAYLWLAAVGVYGLVRRLTAQRGVAFLSAILYLSIPVVSRQLDTMTTEPLFVSMFLAALNLTLAFSASGRWGYAALAGLAMGIMGGTKVSAAYYVPLLLLFAALLPRSSPRARWGKLLLSAACGFMALGAFWYLRNWMDTGNPLYPVRVGGANWTLWEGPWGRAWLATISLAPHLLEPGVLGRLLAACWRQVGPIALLFPLALAGIGIKWLSDRARRRRTWNAALLLCAMALLAIGAYLITPWTYGTQSWGSLIEEEMRQAYVAIALLAAVIGCAWASAAPFRWVSWAALPVVIYGLLTAGQGTLLFTQVVLLGAILVDLALAGGWAFLRAVGTAQLGRQWVIGLALAGLVSSPLLGYALDWYRGRNRAEFYRNSYGEAGEAWQWLDSRGEPLTIAYAGQAHIYPLYGPRYQNELLYINVDGCDGCVYQDYPRAQIRRQARPLLWLETLRHKEVSYLLIYADLAGQYPLEDQWASAFVDTFDLAFAKSGVRIYQVLD